MKNTIKSLSIAAMLMISGAAFASSEPGKDYEVMSPPQPVQGNKIEVLEFFSYQCPHCAHLHPLLSAWEKNMPKDVALTYIAVADFQPTWEPAARAYYALESMGKLKQMDDLIYKSIESKAVKLYDINTFADFVARHGVDRAAFVSTCDYGTFGGSGVKSKMTLSRAMTVRYGIEGTPTLVVDGKYAIPAHDDPAVTIRVLNDVIARVRKEHGKAR